ncbi:MAG: hypothetical protein Q3983_01010 [Capnocytophaga sp.]|nr:hypothetical protein [Capnocytophaga sp.]
MKILSKFKDYYDYKVAEYGMDETLIYDRRLPAGVGINFPQRSWITLNNSTDDEALHSVLYVGNALVHLFATRSKIYTHWDFDDPADWNYSIYDLWYDREVLMNDGKEIKITSYLHASRDTLLEQIETPRAQNIFKLEDQPPWLVLESPLLLIFNRNQDGSNRASHYLNLQELGIYLDSDFVWQHIVQYLSGLKTQAEQSPELPNALKIASKGFDNKRSFRPKMK